MLRRVAAVTAVLVGGLAVPPAASPAAVTAPVSAIRVDQVGYASDGPKVAYLMSGSDLTGVGFVVKDPSGATVEAGVAGPSYRTVERQVPLRRAARLQRPDRAGDLHRSP